MPGGWRTEKPAYRQDGGAKLHQGRHQSLKPLGGFYDSLQNDARTYSLFRNTCFSTACRGFGSAPNSRDLFASDE